MHIYDFQGKLALYPPLFFLFKFFFISPPLTPPHCYCCFLHYHQHIHDIIMPSSKFICLSLRRRGSRINTDRFSKRGLKAQVLARGVRCIWPDFYLEIFIFIEVYLFIKNLTDFRKTVETGVDPGLLRPSTHIIHL